MDATGPACLATAAGLVLAGCYTAQTPDDAATDDDVGVAPTDAWDAPDAGTDAFVPIDAGTPAPDVFDPRDGSPWDAEWQTLAGIPPDCHLEVALHPERLSWPSGRVFAAVRIGGGDVFDVDPTEGTAYPVWYRGLARADGTVLVAFRQFQDPDTGGSCFIDDLATSTSGDVAIHVGYCGVGSSCSLFGNEVSRVFRGRADDFARTYSRIAEYDRFVPSDVPSTPRVALGARLTSLVDIGNAVRVVGLDGTLSEVGGDALTRPVHLGDDVLFVSGPFARVMRSAGGAVATQLHDERGNTPDWLDTDGTTIAWTVGENDLYTGAYDGTLHGTLVRSAPHAQGRVGGGYVARFETATGSPPYYVLTVDRLADGLRARVDFPAYTLRWNSPPLLLVASDEILIGERDGTDVLADVQRIDPRTLTFR